MYFAKNVYKDRQNQSITTWMLMNTQNTFFIMYINYLYKDDGNNLLNNTISTFNLN